MKSILINQFFKESLKYLGWILLFGVLWFRGCSGSPQQPQIVKAIIPEVIGKFESKKPVHETISKVPNSPQLKKGKTIYKENPIDEKLIAENEKLKTIFAKETDSLKKVIAYNKAIQLNKFSTKFEDENIVLNIDGVVQGEVKEITPNYTIKKKTVEVAIKQKETVIRLLAGGGIGFNNSMNKVIYKLDLGFQNRNGDIISAEYLKVGKEEYGVIGFKKSIFNLKR